MTIAEEYEKEREELELNRSLDWSTFSRDYIVAGVKLEPMTLQTWFDLLALKSPLLYGRMPTLDVLADYIWRNKGKKPSNRLLKYWQLSRLKRKVFKLLKNEEEGIALLSVIHKHVKNSLDEFPSEANQKSTRKTNSMSSVSGEASMIDEIAHRYSLHPEEVLKMPLRRAFALQRTIRVSTIPGYKLLEPDSIRAIKSEYLNSVNNGTK
jgi:hypothetical protein